MGGALSSRLLALLGNVRTLVTDDLIGVNQKIPYWLIRIVFLKEVATPATPGIKSKFGVTGFSTSNAILVLWFSF